MAETIDLADTLAEDNTTTTAPAVIEPSADALAIASSDLDSFGIHGDVNKQDLQIPYLSLVQKSGTKADLFPPGSWVVGENQIAEKDSPLQIVVLDILKKYEEVTEYGSGIMPRVFDTAADVRAAGLSLTRGAANEAREIAGMLFWITAPEGADEALFPIVTSDGGRGTIAKYVARSTGYAGVAMPVFTSVSSLGHLRGKHVREGQWQLSAALTKSNGNTYYKVSLRPKGLTPAPILAAIKSLSL
jgi:hypothetical protein